MASLITTLLFAGAIIYIALQNAGNITVHLGYYTFNSVPIYIVMLSSLLAGILIITLIHTLNRLTLALTIHSKDQVISDHQATINQLRQELHELEVENEQLRRIDEEQEEEQEENYSSTYPTRVAPSIR